MLAIVHRRLIVINDMAADRGNQLVKPNHEREWRIFSRAVCSRARAALLKTMVLPVAMFCNSVAQPRGLCQYESDRSVFRFRQSNGRRQIRPADRPELRQAQQLHVPVSRGPDIVLITKGGVVVTDFRSANQGKKIVRKPELTS